MVQLNKKQEEIKSMILEFLISDKISCAITGAAGTGKTTLVQNIINSTRKHIIVTAPTHKASTPGKLIEKLKLISEYKETISILSESIKNIKFIKLKPIL